MTAPENTWTILEIARQDVAASARTSWSMGLHYLDVILRHDFYGDDLQKKNQLIADCLNDILLYGTNSCGKLLDQNSYAVVVSCQLRLHALIDQLVPVRSEIELFRRNLVKNMLMIIPWHRLPFPIAAAEWAFLLNATIRSA